MGSVFALKIRLCMLRFRGRWWRFVLTLGSGGFVLLG